MKALACADLHLNINNRLEDTKNSLKQIMTYCINNQIDIVYILGDIYERSRPYNIERNVFAKFINYLADKNIKVIIISGNHDQDRMLTSTIDDLKILNIKNIEILPNPVIVEFGKFKLFLGHFLVNGAELGSINYSIKSEIKIDQIIKNYSFHLGLLGDVHKHQQINTDPPIFYVGSIEKQDFGERSEEKGFMLIEEKNNDLDYRFIKLKTRPMIQYDLYNYQKDINNGFSDHTEALVKVLIHCSETEVNNIDEQLIRQKLNTAKNIIIEYSIKKENRIRNSDINESITPEKAFLNYADFCKLDKETIQLGLEVINGL